MATKTIQQENNQKFVDLFIPKEGTKEYKNTTNAKRLSITPKNGMALCK